MNYGEGEDEGYEMGGIKRNHRGDSLQMERREKSRHASAEGNLKKSHSDGGEELSHQGGLAQGATFQV